MANDLYIQFHIHTKGQLNSERIFDFSNFPKNQQKICQISALESEKWSNQQDNTIMCI